MISFTFVEYNRSWKLYHKSGEKSLMTPSAPPDAVILFLPNVMQ
jgi:hypothetical protein